MVVCIDSLTADLGSCFPACLALRVTHTEFSWSQPIWLYKTKQLPEFTTTPRTSYKRIVPMHFIAKLHTLQFYVKHITLSVTFLRSAQWPPWTPRDQFPGGERRHRSLIDRSKFSNNKLAWSNGAPIRNWWSTWTTFVEAFLVRTQDVNRCYAVSERECECCECGTCAFIVFISSNYTSLPYFRALPAEMYDPDQNLIDEIKAELNIRKIKILRSWS